MLNYIESRDNAKIKNAVKISQDAKYRRENGVFFASTRKVVCDIIDAGFEAVAVFALESEYEKIKSYTADIPVYVVSRQVCEKLSESKTEDGVFGVFKTKPVDRDKIFSADRLLVLQDIQDPNNMGAILRTALGFGYDNVVVSDKCRDIYSRKVIRTSMTASVKVNVLRTADLISLTESLRQKGFTTVAACLEGASELGKVKTKLPVALYIGNEGNGLSKDVVSACDIRLKIPMSDRIESLNRAVSRAVLMWELRE